MLVEDIKKKRYSLVKILYNSIDDNDKKILEVLESHKGVFESVHNMMCYDVIRCIFNEIVIEHNDGLFALALEYYKVIYLDVYECFLKAEEYYRQCENSLREYDNYVNKSNDEFCKNLFAIFLIFNSDEICDVEKYYIKPDLLKSSAEFIIDNMYISQDDKMLDALSFNTGEKIFESVAWERYIRKRENAIIEFILGKETLTENISTSDRLVLLSKCVLEDQSKDNSTVIVKRILNSIGISNEWYENVVRNTYLYRDIEDLIITYYKMVIYEKACGFNQRTGEKISKIYLARECITPVEFDIINLKYMICTKYISNLIVEILKSRYQEKIFFSDATKELNDSLVIDSLMKKNNLLTKDIENLQYDIENKSKVGENIHQKFKLKYERTILGLEKEIEEKDEKIEELKKKIQSLEEYIEVFKGDDTPKSNDEWDIDKLRGKKYLFVGYIGEDIIRLKKEFPDSIFMENDTINIKRIQIDGIVLFPKLMSHSMYYKVMSMNEFSDIPKVFCYNRNLERIIADMNHLS